MAGKLVAPLIAAPNGEYATKGEDRQEGQKSMTTGYARNSNCEKDNNFFCKQIGRSPNTSYAKSSVGLREKKIEKAGTVLVPALFFAVMIFACWQLLNGLIKKSCEQRAIIQSIKIFDLA